MNKKDDAEKIVIKIDHNNPIDIFDLNDTLMSFGRLYSRYAADTSVDPANKEYRLCVREVRSGSMIFDLVPYTPTIALFPIIVEHAQSIASFGKHVIDLIDFFRGKVVEDADISIQDASDINKLATVSAKNNGTAISIQIDAINYTQNTYIDSNDANAIQNRTRNYIENQKVSAKGLHQNVVMHWGIADRDTGTKKDRAIIEKFSLKPVKIIFANETTKLAMVNEALFTKAYIVDVEVETVDNVPKLYKILNVIEAIDLSE